MANARRDTIGTLTSLIIEIFSLFPLLVSRVMGRAAWHLAMSNSVIPVFAFGTDLLRLRNVGSFR